MTENADRGGDLMTEAYDSMADTAAHKMRVRSLLEEIMGILDYRACRHDDSKLREPEKSVFDQVTPKLKAMTYGSDEYKASLAEMGEALKHHYAANRHHPEHSPRGVSGMTLVDLVEMFCDWAAATERHADGDIFQSIARNQERFGMGEVLADIMRNTAREYQMGAGCSTAPVKTVGK